MLQLQFGSDQWEQACCWEAARICHQDCKQTFEDKGGLSWPPEVVQMNIMVGGAHRQLMRVDWVPLNCADIGTDVYLCQALLLLR